MEKIPYWWIYVYPETKALFFCIVNFVWAFCEKLCLGSNVLKLILYKTIFCIRAHVWTGYFHLGLISMKETSTQHTMDPLVVRGKCPWMVLPSSIHTSDWKCRFLLKKTSISCLLKRFKKKVFFLGELLKWGDLLSCLPSACTKIKKAAVPWHYSSFLGLFSFQYNEQGLREEAAKREEFTSTIYIYALLSSLLVVFVDLVIIAQKLLITPTVSREWSLRTQFVIMSWLKRAIRNMLKRKKSLNCHKIWKKHLC